MLQQWAADCLAHIQDLCWLSIGKVVQVVKGFVKASEAQHVHGLTHEGIGQVDGLIALAQECEALCELRCLALHLGVHCPVSTTSGQGKLPGSKLPL